MGLGATATIGERASMSSKKSMPKIPVLSFFTGAGFLDIGFTLAGFDVRWHNEFNSAFAEGFRFGFSRLTGKSDLNIRIGDITPLDPQEILKDAFGDAGPPSVWGVIGGPPCPDFSVGGKNRGSEGENGALSQVYIDKIMALHPTFFLFENVPGLLRTEKHREFLTQLRRQAEKKYVTDVRILNALEYGVPQDRERVFFVGISRKWLRAESKVPSRKLYDPASFSGHWFPFPPALYPNAKEEYAWPKTNPFGSKLDKPVGLPAELTVGRWLLDPSIEMLPNQTEQFVTYTDKFRTIDEGDDKRKSFKRLHRYRYAPASAYGNNEVHLHPTKARRLTVREALRLQSVPDEYSLPTEMTLSDKFKTVANGVPVKLAQTVAASIRQFLSED